MLVSAHDDLGTRGDRTCEEHVVGRILTDLFGKWRGEQDLRVDGKQLEEGLKIDSGV